MVRTPYLLTAAWLWTLPALAQTPPPSQVLPYPETVPGLAGPSNGSSKAHASSTEAKAAPARPENLVPFDYRVAEIRWIDNRWQLLAGGVWIKDLGRREADAREALQLVRELRLSQRGTVGSPRPVMEYWLADGLAPQGWAHAQRLVTLDQDSLRVEKAQDQWCLRDAHRLFFVFGAHEADARQALNVIRRYGFSQLGIIGYPVPAMLYFMGARDGIGQARMAAPTSISSQPFPSGPLQQKSLIEPAPSPGEPSQNKLLQELAQNPLLLQAGNQLSATTPLSADHPALGDRVSFDHRQVRVVKEGNDWKLRAGEYTIASFGPSEYEARRGLDALHFYRLTEHCLVGEPQPSFSFFLANGQAPRGLMFGLTGRMFRPDALTIRQADSGWAICDNWKALIWLGGPMADAKKLLQIIQEQKFDRISHIGPGEPYGMTLLIRGR